MSSLKLTLFGSPEGELNGERVTFTTRKSLALLVYVMLTKQSHTRETLATLFWPDFSADRAFANLRWTLQSLKHNLSDEWLDIRRHEVAIKEHPGLWVDVHEFERQLDQGRDHEHGPATACAACLPSLLAAIELYRGDFLRGFTLPDCPAFDEWQASQTDRYREHLINGFTHVIQYLASQHDFPHAIAYALRWVGVCPCSETAHRELIRVYALNQQRSAALQQYQTCREMLQEEFGAEPDYETQELYEAIVHQPGSAQASDARAESSRTLKRPQERASVRLSFEPGGLAPGPGELEPPPNNLPAQTTTFIGRETEVAAVLKLLSQPDVRLVTLTGAGGSGKTRLGLQVAAHLLEQYADGVFFVSLAPISNPDLVIPTILQTLGLKVAGSASPLDVLKAYVQQKSLLLVLDNFEQILEAAPVLIDVLAAAPDLNMLVTSRVVLHLSGGHEYLVPPLEVPDLLHRPPLERLMQSEAVRLFAARAQAVHPDFTLTEETTPTVAEICVRLDGLPLAIELAAARIRMFTPQEICSRLGHRLQLLTGGARDLPARQRTIRATIVWSYELLDDAGKTLFHRLGVFVGGWTLDAAERICALHDDPSALRQAQDIAGSGQALDVFSGLESLVDHNLIVHDEQEGQSRFSMLETVREYAVERLLESGEADTIRQRHARVFMELAEEAEPEFFGVDPVVWIQRVECEHNNLRAALAWAIDHALEVGLRLAGALRTFWHVRSYQREGREWVEKALAKSQYAEPALEPFRAKALHCLGWLAIFQSDLTTACTVGEESVALFRTVGDNGGLAQALLGLGVAMAYQGDLAQAFALLEEGIILFRQVDDPCRLAETLDWYGKVAYDDGDYERAYTSAMEG